MRNIYKNEVFEKLSKYIKEHSGTFGLFETPLGEEYKENINKISSFDGKKVQIKFTCDIDFMTNKGYKTGRIKVEDGKLKFYEGRKTTRFYYLDAGIYDGFYATLIPIEIEEIKTNTIIHKN